MTTSAALPPLIPIKLQQALGYQRQGKIELAAECYEAILELCPDHFESLVRLGVIRARLGDPEKALSCFDKAIEIDPASPGAHNNRGLALHEVQRLHDALTSYDRSIALQAGYALAHYNRGNVLRDLCRPDSAIQSYDQAIAHRADFAEARCNRGIVLADLGHLTAALRSCDEAIALKSDYSEAHVARANVLREMDQLNDALASYDHALATNPGYFEAHLNRGVCLAQLKDWNAALACYDRATAIRPERPEPHSNRGNALRCLNQPDAALASYNRAIALEPGYAEAYSNRGTLQRDLKQWDAALASFKQALAIQPSRAEVHSNLADTQFGMGRLTEALASYGIALALKPKSATVLGRRHFARLHLCSWDGLDADSEAITNAVNRGEPTAPPLAVLAWSESPALQRRVAEIHVRSECPPNSSLGPIRKRPRGKRLRLGYFSADFRNHAVALLTTEMFEMHDRGRFEVLAFSFGPETNDPMQRRLQKAFDRFIDVRTMSVRDIALMARNTEVDIAVDLGGFTEHARSDIFALRAAPLQVSYLGFLGTMGAPYIDYLIADNAIIPPEYREFYAEKILYLPSYQANGSRSGGARREFTRGELGLPGNGFVFCCFNANYKIMPETFDTWMRILSRVPESVLLLYSQHDGVADNLRRHAAAKGIDPGRLIFGGRLPYEDYLARYGAADLFLDTFPYNAGTTASDALWAGLPVLTRAGRPFGSRVAASLLTAIALPDLITSTPWQYEQLAVDLANNPERMLEIKRRLAKNRPVSGLFDVRRFTRSLESGYTLIHDRYQAGLPAEHITDCRQTADSRGP